jgi:hypothetical protein
VRFWIVMTEAANTSFHEIVKAKIAEAAIPGSTSGSTTFWNACSRLQPSVHAASSSSIGIPEKIEKVMSTAKGIASVVWTSARPKALSSRPMRMNITASGSARSGSGNARVISTSMRKVALPRNSKRESA